MSLPSNPARVAVSPGHSIELSPSYAPWVEKAPVQDQVIRTLMRKEANRQPLIQGDLVVSGEETRRAWPLAAEFPVHFRKTYYPTAMHPDPQIEFERHARAAEIIGVPPPIGATRNSFRSCFLPGRPLSTLSPFGVEPPDANIAIATSADTIALIGLWRLLEDTFARVERLHAHGFAHGDLFLHNVIVTPTPLGVFPIDFELALQRDDEGMTGERWEEACADDRRELLRHALYVQCGLGVQAGALADASHAALGELVGGAERRFARALARAGG